MKINTFIIILISFHISLTGQTTKTLSDTSSSHVIAFGQSNIDFGQLINIWVEGKIDQNGKVVQANIKRGGWYHLSINSDTTVVFSDPVNCGFGSEQQGTWTLNEMDTTVTFAFSKRIGYANSPGTTDTNVTEIYKINKLTAYELILSRSVDGKTITMPFIKTKE